MPKKEVLPNIEEESKYLVVHYPYPALAQIAERKTERVALAQWVASCVGAEHVIALYSRPTSANKVLVEISKYCPKINNFLGEHKWREFLRNCPPEEVSHLSKVFYCKHGTSRAVKEQGWRVFLVEDSWFRDFDVKKGPFVQPYPKTTWCDVPESIHKDDAVCRPLPVEVFGKTKLSPSPPLIVPGSAAYYSSKAPASKPATAPAQVKTPMQWSKIASASPKSDKSSQSSQSVKSSATPVLAPPPGLEPSSATSVSEDSSDPEELEWPTSEDVIVDDFASISLKSSDVYVAEPEENGNGNGNNDASAEEEGSFWDEAPERPDNWQGKPFCPHHQWSCRPGICQVLANIEREKKRQARQGNTNTVDADGFQRANTRGGRSGRGWGNGSSGQARGNSYSGRGGRGAQRGRAWA